MVEQATLLEERRWRHALAGAVAAALALGATELVAGALSGAPSLVQSVAAVVIDKAPIGVVRAAIGALGTRDKPTLVAGVVVLSLLIGAGLGVAARRRHRIAVAGLAAFGALGTWAGARPPGTPLWHPALAALVGVAAGVATLSLLAWRPPGPRVEVTRLPGGRAAPIGPPGAGGRMAPAGPPGAGGPGGAARPGASTAAGPTAPAGPGGGPVPPEPAPALARPEAAMAGRRAFLAGAGSLLVVGAAAAAGGRLLQRRAGAAARQAAPLARTGAAAGDGAGAAGDLGVPGLSPYITPNDVFYRVDTEIFPPVVDARGWKLKVGGMVDHPFELSYQQLLAMPTEEHDITLVCVSNEIGDRLSGNARWRGVRLDEILRRARPQPGATQLVGVSVDGFTTGFPTALALDGRNALVAVTMNGEPLPDEHGFPARLVVPGVYGYASACKWLQEIRLDRLDRFEPYWMERGWAPGGQMKTMARIDTPVVGRRLRAGKVPVAGVAWSHHVGISKVEVQIDGGDWTPARLGVSDPDTWRQWVVEWDAVPGRHTIRARASDGRGQLQTSTFAESFPSGATGYHTVQVLVG
jgi:DMSO/TMAO reductase YedYZ molybdopterin-dependent catalytic subunit